MNKYYVETIKIFALYKGNAEMKKSSSGFPMFFVKKRNKLKKDEVVDVFGYGANTKEEIISEMNKALAYCNKLNNE